MTMRPPDFSAVYIPPAGPPRGPGPSPEIYAAMGEENLYRLCRDFYEEIGRSAIRPLFSDDLPAASRKIAAFLVGVTGGPPRYREQHGEPMMRARHLAFRIDEDARQEWLRCFKTVLKNAETAYGFPRQHLPGFIRWLEEFSAWMVNRSPRSDREAEGGG